MQTQTFNISGMMCDACVGHVTRALQGVGGVQSATVDLGRSEAVVVFDPTKTSTPQMTEAVAEEGYEASARA